MCRKQLIHKLFFIKSTKTDKKLKKAISVNPILTKISVAVISGLSYTRNLMYYKIIITYLNQQTKYLLVKLTNFCEMGSERLKLDISTKIVSLHYF